MDALGTVINNTFLGAESYLIIGVIVTCFVVGYVIKHYTKIPNEYIPIIMMCLGVIINVLLTISTTNYETGEPNTVNVVTIIAGALSGLASCGLYDMLSKSLGLKRQDGNNNQNSNDTNNDNSNNVDSTQAKG